MGVFTTSSTPTFSARPPADHRLARPDAVGCRAARRLGDHIVAPLPPPDLEEGFEWLFDGTADTGRHCVQAGPGDMLLNEDEGW